MTDALFPTAPDKTALERGELLAPRFNDDGLIAAVATHADTGEVLMFAWMNDQALSLTISTGEAHYWSRSRGELWHKGATSGHAQTVKEMRVDCDQDAIWIKVETAGTGANCHTGRKGCFYRTVAVGQPVSPELKLVFTGDEPLFDPKAVYGDG